MLSQNLGKCFTITQGTGGDRRELRYTELGSEKATDTDESTKKVEIKVRGGKRRQKLIRVDGFRQKVDGEDR